MNTTQWSILLGVVGVILVPSVGFMIRGAIKWTRVEDKLEQLIARVDTIVADKDKIHSELVATMRDDRRMVADQMRMDRDATDKRLRWLEEHLWTLSIERKKNALRNPSSG